jgi:hypothetical protein
MNEERFNEIMNDEEIAGTDKGLACNALKGVTYHPEVLTP